MRWPLALTLALRFSRTRQKNGLVSLISGVSAFSIALGVIVLIIGLSTMNGFERELNNRVLAVVPHGEIEPLVRPFLAWRQALTVVDALPGIRAAPYITFTGLVERANKLQAVQIRAVDVATEPEVSALPRFVAADAWQRFAPNQQQIILGAGIAKALGVKQNDWLTLTIPDDKRSEQPAQPKRVRLQLVGILQLHGMLDYALALIPLTDAQRYLNYGQAVTGIAMKMQDPFRAPALTRQAGEALQMDVRLRNWTSSWGYMYRDIQTIRAIMYLAMLLVIGVACFNIVSTLVVVVKDKRGDIAILYTLGANQQLVRNVFVCYGLMAGLIGSLIGAIIGVVLALNLTQIMQAIERLIGHPFLSADIYFIDFLPSELHWSNVVMVLAIALLLSLLASWYPAKRASRLEPARILNGQ